MPAVAKAFLLYLACGLAVALAFAGLSALWPNVFGVFVIPWYILPALAGCWRWLRQRFYGILPRRLLGEAPVTSRVI